MLKRMHSSYPGLEWSRKCGLNRVTYIFMVFYSCWNLALHEDWILVVGEGMGCLRI